MQSFSDELERRAEKVREGKPITELESMRLAFKSAVQDGTLVDYYEYSFSAGNRSQLFVYSILNGVKNNTVACTCFKAHCINSTLPILITDYTDLYRRVLKNLDMRADVTETLKNNIIRSLKSEYRRICKEYINQFRQKLVSKTKRLILTPEEYYDYCYNCYCKLASGLRNLGVKDLEIQVALSGQQFRGEFYILDDPMMVVHKYAYNNNACSFLELNTFKNDLL